MASCFVLFRVFTASDSSFIVTAGAFSLDTSLLCMNVCHLCSIARLWVLSVETFPKFVRCLAMGFGFMQDLVASE